MSQIFREFLKKIGSGSHTGENLTRQEAKTAMVMLLQQEATPAQIGAFLIAHRIKRPTGEELAGMLDAYDELGPQLSVIDLPFNFPPIVFGTPYDGRSRTAPVTPITALLLAASGVPAVMHGGDRMPTKYGLPLGEIWQGLGVDFTRLSLSQAEQLLRRTGLAFVYLPNHFPLAHNLVPYRDQIGKRPPIATLELIWIPCSGEVHLAAGFVHPPTEELFQEALALRGVRHYTTVKGLEGSCDLACSRTAIIGLGDGGSQPTFERLLLNPRDWGFTAGDVPLDSPQQCVAQIQATAAGKPGNLSDAAIFNGGFYLWRCGVCEDLSAGFALAETLLRQGKVAAKLEEVRSCCRFTH
jgi:anthranilate phosphoribosyltransferase